MPVNRRPGQAPDSAVISDGSEAAIPRSQWVRTRDALADAASRFSRLLISVADPDAPAVGSWRIGDVAAHVRALSLLDALWATEASAPPELAALFESAGTVTLDTLGEFNDKLLGWEEERDPGVLAGRVRDGVALLLDGTAETDPSEQRVWIGGVRVPASAVLTHMLS